MKITCCYILGENREALKRSFIPARIYTKIYTTASIYAYICIFVSYCEFDSFKPKFLHVTLELYRGLICAETWKRFG